MAHHISFSRELEALDQEERNMSIAEQDTVTQVSDRERRRMERDKRKEQQEQKRTELLRLQEEQAKQALELQEAIKARDKEIEALHEQSDESEDMSEENIVLLNESDEEAGEYKEEKRYWRNESQHQDTPKQNLVEEIDQGRADHQIADESNIACGEIKAPTIRRNTVIEEARAALETHGLQANEGEKASVEDHWRKHDLNREKEVIEAKKKLQTLELEKRKISFAAQRALEEIDKETMKTLEKAGDLSKEREEERRALEAHMRCQEREEEKRPLDVRVRLKECGKQRMVSKKKEEEMTLVQEKQRISQAKLRGEAEEERKQETETERLNKFLQEQNKILQEELRILEEENRKNMLFKEKMKAQNQTMYSTVGLGPPIDSSTDVEEEREEEKELRRKMSWLDEKYEKLPEKEKVVLDIKPHKTKHKSKVSKKIKEEEVSHDEKYNDSLGLPVQQKEKSQLEYPENVEDSVERRLSEKVDRLSRKDEELAHRISKMKVKKEKGEQRDREKKMREERIRKLKEKEQSLIESLREKESELSELETSESKEKEPVKSTKAKDRAIGDKINPKEDEKRSVLSFKKPTIPKLTEDSFEEWKMEVEVILKSGLYHEDVIRQEVRNSLSGNTRKILLNMNQDASTRELITKLENIYGNIRSGESVLAEFYNAQQRDNETSAEWGVRIESILNSAIKKGQVQKSQADEMLRNRFWRHLRSYQLKNATRVFYETEKDFEALRRKVRIEENELKTAKENEKREKGEKNVTSQQRTDNSEQLSLMRNLLERMDKLEKEMVKQSDNIEQNKKEPDRNDQRDSERFRSDSQRDSERFRSDSQRGGYNYRSRNWNRGNYRRGYGYRRYRGNYYSNSDRNNNEEERQSESRDNRGYERRYETRQQRDRHEEAQDEEKKHDTREQKKGN